MEHSPRFKDHLKSKQAYFCQLRDSLIELAEMLNIDIIGLYENVQDITPEKMQKGASEEEWNSVISQTKKVYSDESFNASHKRLETLQEMFSQISTKMLWARLSTFFKNKEVYLFNDFSVSGQIMRSRGFTHIIDAISCIASQPGLVIRLFNITEFNKTGAYNIWLNINGVWTSFIVDDSIPVFISKLGKAHFFFSTPNAHKSEIWHCLLEKALAKAYKGYQNLFGGNVCSTLRDLTGSPTLAFDICYLEKGQIISEEDLTHMNKFWNKVLISLSKGFVMLLSPRPPQSSETAESEKEKIFNPKNHLKNGIYAGHSYVIVGTRTVTYNSQTVRLLKIRNPWENEVWTGEWSSQDKEKERLIRYHKEEHGLFWMQLTDVMHFFEILNICKVSPYDFYSCIPIEVENWKISRIVVRVTVALAGKYTFSIDQRDSHFYPSPQYQYSPVSISLGMLSSGRFLMMANSTTRNSRNTFIRKSIEEGEYYVLIEKEVPEINSKLEEKCPKRFKKWRDITLSSLGPHSCSLKIAENNQDNMIYNYLNYMTWKDFTETKGGTVIQVLESPIQDSSSTLSVELGSIPTPTFPGYFLRLVTPITSPITIRMKFSHRTLGPSGGVLDTHDFAFPVDGPKILPFLLLSEPENQLRILSICGLTIQQRNIEISRIFNFLIDFKNEISSNYCFIERFKDLKIGTLLNRSKAAPIAPAVLKKEVGKRKRKSYTVRRSREGSRENNAEPTLRSLTAEKIMELISNIGLDAFLSRFKPSKEDMRWVNEQLSLFKAANLKRSESLDLRKNPESDQIPQIDRVPKKLTFDDNDIENKRTRCNQHTYDIDKSHKERRKEVDQTREYKKQNIENYRLINTDDKDCIISRDQISSVKRDSPSNTVNVSKQEPIKQITKPKIDTDILRDQRKEVYVKIEPPRVSAIQRDSSCNSESSYQRSPLDRFQLKIRGESPNNRHDIGRQSTPTDSSNIGRFQLEPERFSIQNELVIRREIHQRSHQPNLIRATNQNREQYCDEDFEVLDIDRLSRDFDSNRGSSVSRREYNSIRHPSHPRKKSPLNSEYGEVQIFPIHSHRSTSTQQQRNRHDVQIEDFVYTEKPPSEYNNQINADLISVWLCTYKLEF